MLYLEDYLEMIENLPMEMRERFTDMREADLEVHNTVDQLDERVAEFFAKCARGIVKKELRDEQFSKLKAEYNKSVEQSDEKIQIANQVSEMVERHARRLEGELLKFKMELEADNAGITELLEKRSLELDNVPKENNPPREKRKYNTQHSSDKRMHRNQSQDVHTTFAHSPESGEPYSPLPTPVNQYNIVGTSAQNNPAIRAAASQAIAATQQNMPGRRSTSLKASIELASRSSDTWPADSLASSTGSNDMSAGSRSQRVKKPSQKAEELMKAQQAKRHSGSGIRTSSESVEVKSPSADGEAVVDEAQTSADWNADPNEPRYCVCNQVSYGEMVGCDNKDCPLEWFHYGCVGLTAAPKGKWYCPRCLASMKRRNRK